MNKIFFKKIPLMFTLSLLIVSGGVVFYLAFNDSSQSNKPTGGSGINFEPATEQEKRGTEQHKENLINQQGSQTGQNQTNGKKQVQPVITYAGKDEVNAYINGVVEEGGSCTAVLTKNSQIITTPPSTGFANVSTTQCMPISISGYNLGAGSWSVTVSYISGSYFGNSQPYTFTVE